MTHDPMHGSAEPAAGATNPTRLEPDATRTGGAPVSEPHEEAALWSRWPALAGAAWAVTCLVSHAHPGDEYGLYVVSSVLGIWAAVPVGWAGGGIGEAGMSMAVAACGGFVAWGLGSLARRFGATVGVALALWATLTGLVLWGLLRDFSSVDDALGKNGSWTAHLAASSNVGWTGAVVFGMPVGVLVRSLRGPSAAR